MQNSKMSFEEACRITYNIFQRIGNPGINGAVDVGDSWIFSPAPQQPNEVEYGPVPYIVDKKNGGIRCFSFISEDDWGLLDSAKQMIVPEQYRPKYQ